MVRIYYPDKQPKTFWLPKTWGCITQDKKHTNKHIQSWTGVEQQQDQNREYSHWSVAGYTNMRLSAHF